MAQKAESLNVEALRQRLAAPVLLLMKKRQRLRSDALAAIKHVVSGAYCRTQTRAGRTYLLIVQNFYAAATAAKQRGQTMVREKPLRVVAMAAGIGVFLGVGLRVWRSRHNE